MSRWILTSDIHLTARPRDEYRWSLFPWLKTQATNRDVDTIAILGDLTDAKDQHAAVLVDRVVEAIRDLAEDFRVVLLVGNHDYVDPTRPFFRFLRHFENVVYIVEPTEIDGYALALPHTRAGRAWDKLPLSDFQLLLCHQTFTGARASNGMRMRGTPRAVFDDVDREETKIVSGDIHVPQSLAGIHYCGSPHPVNFGDDFDPRVLLYDSDRERLTSVRRTTLRKSVLRVRSVEELEDGINRRGLGDGDQLKVAFELPVSEFSAWDDIRDEVRTLVGNYGAELCGLSLSAAPTKGKRTKGLIVPNILTNPLHTLARFAAGRNLEKNILKAGEKFLCPTSSSATSSTPADSSSASRRSPLPRPKIRAKRSRQR